VLRNWISLSTISPVARLVLAIVSICLYSQIIEAPRSWDLGRSHLKE
jgi:hypothetical protein